MQTLRVVSRQITTLRPNPKNKRVHNARNLEAIKASLARWKQQRPIVIDERGVVWAGCGTLLAARDLGWKTLRCVVTPLKGRELSAYALADNRTAELAEWDESLADLLSELQREDATLFAATGFDDADLAELLDGETSGAAGSLQEKFIVPPFSVLDARQGYWKVRKEAWLSIGLASGAGRGTENDHTEDGLTYSKSSQPPEVYAAKERIEKQHGRKLTWQEFAKSYPRLCRLPTDSIFDPVLCELAYRWFCPPGGQVLDPFAGGSVRGVVASRLGYEYRGIDLRNEQVKANRIQARKLCCDPMPEWTCDDSLNMDLRGCSCDLVFSCPPYADLEVYSDDKRDLSNMPYDDFAAAYTEIIGKTCAWLRDNRFACFVVGDVRDKQGIYRNLPALTVEAFAKAGLRLYNEAVLLTPTGSLPIRAGVQFSKSRKLGKAHQNVLVFVKGDAKKAAKAVGPVEVGEVNVTAEA